MTRIKQQVGGLCKEDGCGREHYGRGLCKMHHQRAWLSGEIQPNVASLKQKIEEKSVLVTESGCRIWLGHTNNKGYGRISVGKQKSCYAHRVSYEEYKGPIPDGMEVCHKCDTPICCNADHLFLGTRKDNMGDAARKGRIRMPEKFSGSKALAAKLSTEDVAFIRGKPESTRAMAARFNIHISTVYDVLKRRTYRDLP